MVSTVHGLTGGTVRHRGYERLMIAALRRYDGVVAVSGPIAQSLRARGVPSQRLAVITNAWQASAAPVAREEARQLLGLPADGFALGWVGRFVPEKGPDVLAGALRALPDRDWMAVLAGDGPQWQDVRASLDQAGLAQRVLMPGAIADVARLLKAFDLFVLSSRTEGTPIALLEAMAAGVPVVATAVGGVPDVVGDSEALLIPPDAPAALAQAIDAVWRDPVAAGRRALGAHARLGSRPSVEAWCEAYTRVYDLAVA